MISTSVCRTSTPRNCRQDYESPLHISFSKIPAPSDWKEVPSRRCVVGLLVSRPKCLAVFVGGDSMFLPPDFIPLSSDASLSMTGRDDCVVAKLYLPGRVLANLTRLDCQLPRDVDLPVEFHHAATFSFWIVEGRSDFPEVHPFEA
jgi:hypothetical protein